MLHKNLISFSFLILLIPLISSIPQESGSPLTHTIAINYSTANVNSSEYWNGYLWSDTRWLDIDGGNANQPVDIGAYSFSSDGLISSGDITPDTDAGINIGNAFERINQIFLYGDLSNGLIGGDINVTEMISAYTHSKDSSQAHDDYLKNDANDIQSGYLTNRGLYPETNNTYDIGQTITGWRNLYLYGRLISGSKNISVAEMRDAYSFTTNGTFLTSYTETDPRWSANYTAYNSSWSNMTNSSYLTEVLGDEDWITIIGLNNVTFNSSKLSTIYYNSTQSAIINGVVDGGTLQLTQHPDGSYDGVTFNFSEVSGSPALDLRVNFTNIPDFTQGMMRYKTSVLAGEHPIIQLWDYDTSSWESYPEVTETLNFLTIAEPVFDASGHIQNGVVQMRIYKSSNGNTNNHYYIDWLAIAKGFGVPAGQEIDPLSHHTGQNINSSGYNITADYYLGNGSQLTNLPNPFDQILNTTSNVTFQNLKVNSTAQINNTLTFQSPIATLVDDGLMRVRGSWGGASVFALMSFKPNVTQGTMYGFHINPTINTNSSNYGIYDQPLFASNVLHKFIGHKMIYPEHTSNFADTLGMIEETTTRTYINTLGKVDINGISLGQAILYGNLGGGEPDYEENMITLTGGITEIVPATLSPIQRGLKIIGFGNKGGTNVTMEAIYMDGGDINIDSDASFIKMGADQDALIRFDGTNLNINMTTNGALTIYNTTGLGKIRANQYATSTPKDADYTTDAKYIDTLPAPENLLDEDGKIVIGALRQSQTTYWETDFKNCEKVGTGRYWYCYDVVVDGEVQEKEFCQYTQVEKTNKYLTKERYVEIMEEVCGQKEVNVTLVETQAFENTIMISELNQKVSSLESELKRIKDCTAIAKDFEEYKICVGASL